MNNDDVVKAVLAGDIDLHEVEKAVLAENIKRFGAAYEYRPSRSFERFTIRSILYVSGVEVPDKMGNTTFSVIDGYLFISFESTLDAIKFMQEYGLRLV